MSWEEEERPKQRRQQMEMHDKDVGAAERDDLMSIDGIGKYQDRSSVAPIVCDGSHGLTIEPTLLIQTTDQGIATHHMPDEMIHNGGGAKETCIMM